MKPQRTWWIVVVVVRHDGRYLLVRQSRLGQNWYFPAGRVGAGEDVRAAAVREASQETGIEIELDGLLAVEHRPGNARRSARLRLWFTGRPVDPELTPKRRGDRHSLEARWVASDELAQYPLRAPEVRQWLQQLEAGTQPAPLTLLRGEGAPYPDGSVPQPPHRGGDRGSHSAAGPQPARRRSI